MVFVMINSAGAAGAAPRAGAAASSRAVIGQGDHVLWKETTRAIRQQVRSAPVPCYPKVAVSALELPKRAGGERVGGIFL